MHVVSELIEKSAIGAATAVLQSQLIINPATVATLSEIILMVTVFELVITMLFNGGKFLQ